MEGTIEPWASQPNPHVPSPIFLFPPSNSSLIICPSFLLFVREVLHIADIVILPSRCPSAMAAECYECYTCEKAFPAGWQARENHCRATGHSAPPFECDTCPRYFGSQRACNDHMNTLDHFADDSDDSYECDICDETWPSEEDLTEHEIRDHYYCDECDRTFQSYNNIRAVSLIHPFSATRH